MALKSLYKLRDAVRSCNCEAAEKTKEACGEVWSEVFDLEMMVHERGDKGSDLKERIGLFLLNFKFFFLF